ncbi:MAG: hypothetical protein P8X51_19470 [Maritimibacter sp.]
MARPFIEVDQPAQFRRIVDIERKAGFGEIQHRKYLIIHPHTHPGVFLQGQFAGQFQPLKHFFRQKAGHLDTPSRPTWREVGKRQVNRL